MMATYLERQVHQLVEEAVAEDVSRGRFPTEERVRAIRVRSEAAAYLAALSDEDPETVYVVGVTRELVFYPDVGDYLVRARDERTLAPPTERVALYCARGVTREEVLERLDLIRAHVEELLPGTTLAADDLGEDPDPDPVTRLEAARKVVLTEIEAGNPF